MAAIVEKKSFSLGLILTIGFVAILVILFSPVFHGQTGLYRIDETFNGLAKGSTYFTPELLEKAEKWSGKDFEISLHFKTGLEKAEILFKNAGCEVVKQGDILKIKGDLGKLGKAIVKDTEDMYHNRGELVKTRYGFNSEKEVLYYWWLALKQMDKTFKKAGRVKESGFCHDLLAKGVEASYNFYGVEPEKVGGHVALVTFLLIFYVVYTVWWGFAIYYLFEGLGLKTTKAKVKKEA